MKPNFTDKYRYSRAYVRSELTNVAKTWAAARKELGRNNTSPEDNIRTLQSIRGTRT